MNEIKTICDKMQLLDQDGSWYEIPLKWDEMTEIEHFNELSYISSTIEEWLEEGVTEAHRHILNNVLDMVNSLELGIDW